MRKLDLVFIAYLIAFSVAPLAPLRGWQGYGPAGEFSYTGSRIYLRYSDPTFGNDKPHLFIVDRGYDVDFIEYSDQGSWASGLNLYRNYTVETRLVGDVLFVHYSSRSMNLTKSVEPTGDGVVVKYEFSHPTNSTITLWRWYFETVDGFGMPVTRELEDGGHILFTALDRGVRYRGEVIVSPVPDNATISGEEAGINKISLRFVNVSKVTIRARYLSSQQLNRVAVMSLGGSRMLYPVIGVAEAVAYLLITRRVEGIAGGGKG